MSGLQVAGQNLPKRMDVLGLPDCDMIPLGAVQAGMSVLMPFAELAVVDSR